MRLKSVLTSLGLALAAVSSQAAIQAPWLPDGSGTGENNLYQLLGVANNTTLNSIAQWDVTLDPSAINQRYSSLLIEQAGNRNFNSFGVYDAANPGTKLEIFAGGANPVVSTTLSISDAVTDWKLQVGATSVLIPKLDPLNNPNRFGFYLARGGSWPTFYSQKSLNVPPAGGTDQMAGFDITQTKYGQPPFPSNTGLVLAWEDLNNYDWDYNDMIVTMTAAPIPEPATMIAGGLLLLPFAASTIRFVRKNRKA